LRQAYDYWQDQPGNFCVLSCVLRLTLALCAYLVGLVKSSSVSTTSIQLSKLSSICFQCTSQPSKRLVVRQFKGTRLSALRALHHWQIQTHIERLSSFRSRQVRLGAAHSTGIYSKYPVTTTCFLLVVVALVNRQQLTRRHTLRQNNGSLTQVHSS
jgi:hypothetical protein